MRLNRKGTVLICEKPGGIIEFEVNLSNLKPGKHGFHIHEAGNLSEGCKSCCSHFNPLGAKHGGLHDKNHSRHLGDLEILPLISEEIVVKLFKTSV